MYYFDTDTDEYIVKFLETEDQSEKQKIFNDHIRPAFEKLVENIIYVYGFYTIDDVETLSKEALSALYEVITKFKIEKSTRAFSYFNIITKNWFFQKIKELNKKNKFESELCQNIDNDALSKDHNLMIPSFEEEIFEKEFCEDLIKGLCSWRPKIKKKSELATLESIIFILENSDAFPIYNKKAINIYIREYTGLGSKQIAANLKKLKKMYVRWKKNYLNKLENP